MTTEAADPKTVRQLLDELGYSSRDHDSDVRGALEELVVAREAMKQSQDAVEALTRQLDHWRKW